MRIETRSIAVRIEMTSFTSLDVTFYFHDVSFLLSDSV